MIVFICLPFVPSIALVYSLFITSIREITLILNH